MRGQHLDKYTRIKPLINWSFVCTVVQVHVALKRNYHDFLPQFPQFFFFLFNEDHLLINVIEKFSITYQYYNDASEKPKRTRMHSSRMRTVRCSGRRGGYLPGGVSAQGRVSGQAGGCLPPPCEQNHRCLWKHYLAVTTLQRVIMIMRKKTRLCIILPFVNLKHGNI